MDRSILHVDMDAFFAAIEQFDRPELRGQPILVGSESRRGVVATASYEARPFGCRSAQPMAQAKRLCPHAIVVRPRGARYREVSTHVFEILRAFSPLVEPLSIDEAFLDLTGTEGLFGPAPEAAEAIRARIRSETGLTASVGVAPNKFLAKLASDRHKPDGLTVVTQSEIEAWLPTLPVGRMWGIGPATAARLEAAGVRIFGDLADAPAPVLASVLGRDGERVRLLARGIDDRPVVPHREAKSMGHEETFPEDLEDPDRVRRVLLAQAEDVARRLRKDGVRARGVTVKIRFGHYETITRHAMLDRPTSATDDLRVAACEVFDRWAARSFRPVRLIGITASPLAPEHGQLALFSDAEAERRERLDGVTDRIVERFGKGVIRRGDALERETP